MSVLLGLIVIHFCRKIEESGKIASDAKNND